MAKKSKPAAKPVEAAPVVAEAPKAAKTSTAAEPRMKPVQIDAGVPMLAWQVGNRGVLVKSDGDLCFITGAQIKMSSNGNIIS